LLYLSFCQQLPMATGPLCCLCFATLSCTACVFEYLVYGTCIVYVACSTRHLWYHCLWGLWYLHTFYAGLWPCPTWPDHNFVINSRPLYITDLPQFFDWHQAYTCQLDTHWPVINFCWHQAFHLHQQGTHCLPAIVPSMQMLPAQLYHFLGYIKSMATSTIPGVALCWPLSNILWYSRLTSKGAYKSLDKKWTSSTIQTTSLQWRNNSNQMDVLGCKETTTMTMNKR